MKNLNGWLVCASVLLIATGAAGAGLPNKKAAPALEIDVPDDLSRFEVYSALDVHSHGSIFGYGSVTYAPFNILDKSGVRLKLEGLNGGYDYNVQGDPDFSQPPVFPIHGHFVGASALVGYEYVSDNLNVAGYVGADYQRVTERFNPADRFGFLTDPLLGFGGLSNPTVGTRWGVKFMTEIDYRPNDLWSFDLSGNYSTANNSWWSRFRPGYAVLPDVYVGPETGFQGNNFYRQWRIGAHERGFKLGPVEVGLASGFLRDDVVGNGVYGTVEASVRF